MQMRISQQMRVKVPECRSADFPLVENDRVHNLLRAGFSHANGGMKVIVCPSGSGKSTYIRKYTNEFIDSGGNLCLFGSELKSPDDFYNAFGGSERRYVLPKKSTIIIDQLD